MFCLFAPVKSGTKVTILEFVLFMLLGFFCFYGIVTNIVLYRKLRTKYYMAKVENLLADPSLKYSELVMDRDDEVQSK